MTALERVNVAGLGISADDARRLLGGAVWQWFHEHQDDVVLTKRVVFFSVTLRVRDLRFLIERIAGPEPAQF